MTQAPKCKLCGTRHWISEGHRFKEPVTVVSPTNVTPISTAKDATSVTKRGFGSGRGRPRKHKNAAARQKAYRDMRHV